jgi:hypothetical protein
MISRMGKVALAILGAALVAAIAIAYVTSTAWYRLWRYRRDPDAVVVYEPPLCERGPSVLPAIYRAFDEHGADADVGKFRLGIVSELRCIRRHEGEDTNEANAYLDVPDEPRLVDTIVRAWNQEPDVAIRGDMWSFMPELDFRAWFGVWAGIERGPHPLRGKLFEVPEVKPYASPDHASEEAPVRAEWCRVVRPIAIELLAGSSALDDADLPYQLGLARCGDSDLAVLQNLVRRNSASPGQQYLGAVNGLAAATVPPERAAQTIVPLLDGNCDAEDALYVYLQHALDARAAAIVAQRLASCRNICDDPATCVSELAAEMTSTR